MSRYRCLLLLIVLVAIATRACYLSQPMRYDEAVSFTHYASRPLSECLSEYSYPNNHLFHTLLVRAAYLALGNRPWAIRLPAFLAGVLLVPASYLAARLLYDRSAALLSAGILSASSSLIEYSTNARGYTIVCLAFVLLLALGTWLTRTRSRAPWLLFVFLGTLGFYTIPIMLYPFGIVATWLLMTGVLQPTASPRLVLLRRVLLCSAAVCVLTAILYYPVVRASGIEAVVANRYVSTKPWSAFVGHFPSLWRETWRQWNRDIPCAIRLLMIVGLAVSLACHGQMSAYRVPLPLAALVWLAVALLVQRPVTFPRIWLFLLPLYVIVSSAGLCHVLRLVLPERRDPVTAVLALCLSLGLAGNTLLTRSVFYSPETGTLRDAERIALFLADRLKPGDGVLSYMPSNAIMEYYFILHGLPRSHLFPDLARCNDLFVIVNESHGQTIRQILSYMGKARSRFGEPQEVSRYESASVYLMKRLP